MKLIAPALIIFALLTDPSGAPVWIARNQVIAVTKPYGCSDGAGAKVLTLTGFTCVAETPERAVQQIETP